MATKPYATNAQRLQYVSIARVHGVELAMQICGASRASLSTGRKRTDQYFMLAQCILEYIQLCWTHFLQVTGPAVTMALMHALPDYFTPDQYNRTKAQVYYILRKNEIVARAVTHVSSRVFLSDYVHVRASCDPDCIINFDETPVAYDLIGKRTRVNTGVQSVTARANVLLPVDVVSSWILLVPIRLQRSAYCDAFELGKKSFRKTFRSLRKQATLDLHILTNAMNNCVRDYIGVDFATSDFVSLKSEENCPSQTLHMDYNPLYVDTLKENYPLGATLALEDGTRLNVYCGSINRIKNVRQHNIVETNISKGSVLFFLGYLLHAGCIYRKSNHRVHFLCANPTISIDTDATHIVEIPSDTDDNYIPSPYAEVFSKGNGKVYRTRNQCKTGTRKATNSVLGNMLVLVSMNTSNIVIISDNYALTNKSCISSANIMIIR
ncbi:hypothetical protein ROZALSC1DRAFT_24144 [Rozella allomycis CSF55]|uniref:Uncharacterized protein n=1 Tax=Rozella allomycis (strain CSF55) TaxID=988480 RepID=A0A4P9YDU5_ROZAC|nr:hypothetical protein ROZALSC1DRAFT_24144 [Rozella allomycis CSF55]